MRAFVLVVFWLQFIAMLLNAGKALSYRGTKGDAFSAIIGVLMVVWGAHVLGWV